MTVAEFLEARIAEDEAAARRCAEAFPGSWDVEDRGYRAHVVCDEPYFHHVSELDERHTNVEHLGGALQMIAEFNPARVLAECAAKRAILRRHATITVWPDGTGGAKYYYGSKKVCASCDERTQTPCPTIGLLAAVYSDHPDYDKDWAL